MDTKQDLLSEYMTMSEKISKQHNFLKDDVLEKCGEKDLLPEESQATVSKVPVTEISRKNWRMSYRKWRWIVILARLRVRFHTINGYYFLKVVGKCGYCIELNSNCFSCNLYKQNLCCSIKYLTKDKREKTALWKYLHVMQKCVNNYSVKINWKKEVLAHAIEMRDAIKKDKPGRQNKISLMFTPLQIFSPKAV